MKKVQLIEQLRRATGRAVEFARSYCHQSFLGPVQYRVLPNQSYDLHREHDEVVYPQEELPSGQSLGPWSADEVATWMWRDGRVPVWVDICVFAEFADAVVVELRCAGRFSANPIRLYYECSGQPSPFGVKSPRLPPGWSEGDRFDVGWHVHRGA